jgi:hypothetical protein
MHRAHVKSGGRYPVLRALGILYMVGSVAALCYGLYWMGWSLFASPGSMGERIALAGGVLVATFIAVVTILAIAELIKLIIDIEHNTRMAAMNGGGSGNGVAIAGEGHANRLSSLEEESAEAALLRGH